MMLLANKSPREALHSCLLTAKNIFHTPFLAQPLESEQDILLSLLNTGKSLFQDKFDGGSKKYSGPSLINRGMNHHFGSKKREVANGKKDFLT